MNYFHEQLGSTIHCTTYNHDDRTKEDPGTPLEEIQGPTITKQMIDTQLNLETKGMKIPMVLDQWSWMQCNNKNENSLSLREKESKDKIRNYALNVADQDTCQRIVDSNVLLVHHNEMINEKQ